jgi:hypothetical protein
MSTKRSRVFTVAAAGTLTLAAAISAAAVTLPSTLASAPASTAAAYVTTVSGHPAAALSARSAAGSGIQQAVLFDRMRSIDGRREQQELAAAQARARAAARKAAAKAAASKAAASKAAAQPSAEQAQVEQQDAVTTASGSPQQIAEQMLSQYGWSSSQFSCLDPLWTQESGWNVYAENPSSGAYGIAQALPGSEMASAGSDWESDAATQIRWGLTYITDRYGSPCAAWAHEEADGWY